MRATGVTPNFQPPTRQTPSTRMWITVALCVLLPPVGLILLWTTARNPLRGKLIISIIALLSMTLMLTLFLLSRQPKLYGEQQNVPVDYAGLPQMNQTVAATPTPAPTAPIEADDVQTDEVSDIIPANPAG